MQIKINLPDKLTEKVGDKWENLQQKIIANLALEAFREGLIDIDELKQKRTAQIFLRCRTYGIFPTK
ncbi:hypothetical protein [Okeania sp.]|uniref:hypothetical protein n=1 Tax=Okeania sp. TaxID=3100323 RepID=UPI002B4B7DA6|nr:hypothetical protein [Okeania sp.]MEB3341442.1 hypothetical protein [Okeania sp.]